jgi:23S rRNA (pseudouridine1915-N3)-methyltransferase
MKLVLSLISTRRGGLAGAASELINSYIERCSYYCSSELRLFASEEKFVAFLDGPAGRTRPVLIFADSTGKLVTSEDLADTLSRTFDSGTQTLVFAIGPADGWSASTLSLANHRVAFGRITLPHELAGAVAAEQLYRALTIRAGHPYHGGH